MTTGTRKTKVAANVRAYYARAEYVTPRIALDKPHAAALRRYMKREGLGVSDAIRAAILSVATPSKPAAMVKTRPARRRAGKSLA